MNRWSCFFMSIWGLASTTDTLEVNVRDRILKVCAGLPLALATAASLVQLSDYKWELVDHPLPIKVETKGRKREEFSHLAQIEI